MRFKIVMIVVALVWLISAGFAIRLYKELGREIAGREEQQQTTQQQR